MKTGWALAPLLIAAGRGVVVWMTLGVASASAATSDQYASAEQTLCTYDTYQWNARSMEAVGRTRVTKPRASLSVMEVDPATGCSVCLEDQVEIRLDGVAPFRLCKHLAARVGDALRELQLRGVPIRSVEGYRVGRTRGAMDAAGNRTRFSNHSFGIAVDINQGANGLYESCVEMGPHCRLRKGGAWDPARNPLSMTADHPVVVALRAAGLRWGGQLQGTQKDFMHFSPAGD